MKPRTSKTKKVTERFIKAMYQILAEKKAKGLKYTQKDFVKSLDYRDDNLQKLIKQDRDVTLNLVVKLCEVHKVNPTWLISGQGEMRTGKNNHSLEKRVEQLEKLMKKAAH